MRSPHLWTVLLSMLPCFAAPGAKIAPDLNTGDAEIDVIVQFTSPPSDQQNQIIAGKGGRLKGQLGRLNAAVYTMKGKAAPAVAALPYVTYISPDRPVRGQLDYSTAAVNANLAWKYGWTGKDVGIAVVDSGISQSADLKAAGQGRDRVVYAEAFGGLHTPVDAYGHGTHVAGIIAGDGSESSGRLSGIAPKANLINLRVLDDSGAGPESAVIAAIARAIELKDQYNIRVLNLSLGRRVYESYRQDPLCQVVEAAWKAGIVVAAGNAGRDNSSGNQGYGTINSPANNPYVITVGAMKSGDAYSRGDDLIASYSSKGSTAIDHIVKPDLVAPGNRVVSTLGWGTHALARMYPQNAVGATYFRLSGTSMAAPVVSGAAALLLKRSPALTPDQVKARLMKTAARNFPVTSFTTDPDSGVTYFSTYDMFTIGAGYLDISAALVSNDLTDQPALSPSAVYNAASGTVSPISAASAIWGSSLIWGSSVIWGDSVIWGSPGDGPGDRISILGEP